MQNKKIPIVFAFDDKYAMPGGIAIASLIQNKRPNTEYDVFVMHGGLKRSTMRKIERICPVTWIKVDIKILKKAPKSSSWPLEVYFRLLIPSMIHRYDKIIWSDVDVLFCGDLSDIYNAPLHGADWAGIPAERGDETNGVHTHFPENAKDFIYMSGFMVINAKKWRDENKLDTFFETIRTFGPRLRFFDLDVLNLACDKIAAVPFEYCVLENIYDTDDITSAPEYPWLSRVHSLKTLRATAAAPKVIHYAGRNIKIWNRLPHEIPAYYWEYIERSPFYNPEFYFPTWRTDVRISVARAMLRICPIHPWRQELKLKIKKLSERKGIQQ